MNEEIRIQLSVESEILKKITEARKEVNRLQAEQGKVMEKIGFLLGKEIFGEDFQKGVVLKVTKVVYPGNSTRTERWRVRSISSSISNGEPELVVSCRRWRVDGIKSANWSQNTYILYVNRDGDIAARYEEGAVFELDEKVTKITRELEDGEKQ